MQGLERRSSKRIATGLLIAALCVATFAVKLHLAAEQVVPGYGDASHYFALARNLFEGRGTWVDYSATWLSNPRGLPVSGTSYWMPMPSWLGALGMLARGEATYHAACEGMIAFTSLAPLVAYLCGRDLLGSARTGVLAAFLAATFHLFLEKASLPLTHGPTMLFGGLALWATARSVGDRRFLWAAGAFAAFAQETRSDGIVWLPVIALTHLSRRDRPPLFALWPAAVAWALAMTPLFVTNSMTQGRLWPESLLRAALIQVYPELYSLPERLTVARFLEQGVARIALDKAVACWENAVTFVTGTATGSSQTFVSQSFAELGRGPLELMVLALIGARALWGRPVAPFWIHAGLQWVLYSLVFTHTGLASFRATMFAVYPLILAVAAHGLVVTVTFAARIVPARLAGARSTVGVLLAALALAGIAWHNVTHAARAMDSRVIPSAQSRAMHAAIVDALVTPYGLASDTLLVSQQFIYNFHANTRLRVAPVPYAARLEEIRDAAARIGATHLIIDDIQKPIPTWPALVEFAQSPLFERVDAVSVQGRTLVLWRVVR